MMSLHARSDARYSFRWLGSDPIPDPFDLRHSGWTLDETGEASGPCIDLVHVGRRDSGDWQRAFAIPVQARRFVLVVGAGAAQERAMLIQAGFGEAVHDTVEAGELDARASRLALLLRWLPRYRRIGDLELDLLAREGFGFGKSLNLNPREFALIWRLADTLGQPVSKRDLIQDVWRMGFVPETNSIAVHMSRLRRKLGFVGLSSMVTTASTGGYCLVPPSDRRVATGRSLPSHKHSLREPAPAGL
jgi:two-component system OmpR family response regulator